MTEPGPLHGTDPETMARLLLGAPKLSAARLRRIHAVMSAPASSPDSPAVGTGLQSVDRARPLDARTVSVPLRAGRGSGTANRGGAA